MHTGPAEPATRVLLVEDDDPLREAMACVLARAGYEVVAVSSGADALERSQADRPDAAVIDVFLRDAGGLGVARGLRNDWADVPVLFVTGLGLPAVREALAPAPVLFKPFTRRQLLDSVRAVAGPGRAP